MHSTLYRVSTTSRSHRALLHIAWRDRTRLVPQVYLRFCRSHSVYRSSPRAMSDTAEPLQQYVDALSTGGGRLIPASLYILDCGVRVIYHTRFGVRFPPPHRAPRYALRSDARPIRVLNDKSMIRVGMCKMRPPLRQRPLRSLLHATARLRCIGSSLSITA